LAFSRAPRTKPRKYSIQAMAHTFTEIGKNALASRHTRSFDAQRGLYRRAADRRRKNGREKILYVNEFSWHLPASQFKWASRRFRHQKMLNAIEILGTAVAPIVRNDLGVTL